jgi:HK97 family phage major capsid protein
MPKLATLAHDANPEDVRTALVDAGRTLLELRSTPEDKRAESFAADIKQTADYIHDLDLAYRAIEHEVRAQREADEAARNKARGNKSFGADTDPQFEGRSMGRQVTEGEAWDAYKTHGHRSGAPFTVEVRNLIGGFTAGAYDSGADGWLPVGSPQLHPGSIQRMRMTVRNLMSVQSTGLRVVPYVRETSQTTNESGAAMTSEGSAKSEVTAEFENYNAVIEKITAWIPVTEEILTDAPTLRGYIDTRLAYMLDYREEAEVLTGSGSTPHLEGLDNVSGIQTQSSIAGDFPATIGAAIGKIENVDGEATGVVANPLDYWVGVTQRHANGLDNGFGGNAPGGRAADGNITWGLPCVRTRGRASGYAYVADWQMGATLFDRQQTTIKVGDQHSDYFTRNLLVILAEKRVGVAWHRPGLFVKAAVPTALV